MMEFIDFLARHWLLTAAAVVLVVMLIATEVLKKMRKFKDVTVAQAARMVGDENTLVLDCREPDEHRAGHLRDSVLIPVGSLKDRVQEIEKYREKPVLVYCRSGNRSVTASNILVSAGFTDVSNMLGGILAWENENYPVKRKK
ncbi:MAG: rhodanese-like domain-containing protein [Halothiobacillaceae bacterium]